MTVAGSHRKAKGFTLLELMISLVVASIVLATAVPGMQSFFDGKRLIDATEQVYSHLQLARLESIARSDSVNGMSVNFSANGTVTWQYGISHNASCDLTKLLVTDANACVMVIDDGDGDAVGNVSVDNTDLVLMRFSDTAFAGVTMNAPVIAGGGTDITFEPVRGMADVADIKLFSAGGKQLTIRVGALGQIRICSNDGSVSRYSTAGCV